MTTDLQQIDVEEFSARFNALLRNVASIIKGKNDEVALTLVCMLAEGHLLLEDVPGTGKTSLAKSIAASIEGGMSRVQFTPDLLPADVTGGLMYDQAAGTLEFRPGPIFANLVLADEINRASPKTQSSLLEVMEERQVTVGDRSWLVPRPFVVIATQNPVEQEGTYRLPEAQLDRFLMRTTLGYPAHESEVDVLASVVAAASPAQLQPVLTTEQVQELIAIAGRVHVSTALQDYMVSLAAATRSLPELRLGASTRGAIALLRAGRALAASQARVFVTIDDVKAVAEPVLAHRLLLTPDAELDRVKSRDLVERVLAEVPVPEMARS
ncbi:MAG: MoxR family ATPase [Actinomycetia bacterium]|nr:MoxR family ATPase [Actinomycetes bacterium]MCP3911553.1 MoxR family ATPase [Actinomycetes bacterium]MCP4083830.1 MoxR family ATPase [Actinomycetes bacterium]